MKHCHGYFKALNPISPNPLVGWLIPASLLLICHL